jgi:precorrin-2 dehydrogenase
MSRWYPVFVDLRAEPCLVVGGGAVAERKIAALLDCDARVTVVAPHVTTAIAAWARERRIVHVARTYRADDLTDVRLAFVATDDTAVNATVAADGRTRGVWVNAADDPAHCDFILPSVMRRGSLTVAVGTGGASPALARLVREEIERVIGEEYGALVSLAADVRAELLQRGHPQSGEAWRRSLDDGVLNLVRDGRHDAARARLLSLLEAESCA